MISLMSYVLKILLKIIQPRFYGKSESSHDRSQFSFPKGVCTREALPCIQVLDQNCTDVHEAAFLCFIEYEKAFRKAQYDKLTDILKNIGENRVRFIKNL